MNPKVSVIIPTYNSEKTIGRAIKSVLGQTFQDWELIIVDDASKDKTVEIIKKFQELDKRIKLKIRNENSGSPIVPRNEGIEISQGEYIAFLDADDVYFPENLEKRSQILDENSEIDIVTGFSWWVEENSKKIINYGGLFPVNLLFRKKLFYEVGHFRIERGCDDDVGWFSRYSKLKGNKGVFYSESPLTLYFRSKNQLSELRGKNPLLCARRLENFFKDKDFEISPIMSSYLLTRIGNFYCLAGNLEKGREYLLKSLKLSFNFLSLILYLLSFLGKDNYKTLERILRFLNRAIFWQIEKILAEIKYKDSYKKAINLLRKL